MDHFLGGNQGPPCEQEEGGILGEIERKLRRAEELVLPTWLGAEERRLQGFIPNRNPGRQQKEKSFRRNLPYMGSTVDLLGNYSITKFGGNRVLYIFHPCRVSFLKATILGQTV